MIRSKANASDERLRRIEAVTDAALSGLDAAQLLDELLDRVRELLAVDTATIMLLDPHARQLVATATRGLEEEVREGLRLGIGLGFAGRVARERQPLVIEEVTDADDIDPMLRARGIRALLGVPMIAGGRLVGVLHAGSFTPRRFTEDDVHLLQLAAERACVAAQARSSANDRSAALALQRSLLPTELPEVPGVELAARYVPGHASGVGGDWYDVFTLPSGWLGVVIGDVSGHGLSSAVVMGRLRSALRAYTLVCDDPAEALVHLDRKVHHFEAGNLATVLYAMMPPDRATIHISLAGHLRPMLAAPGQPAGQPPIPVDPPLGTGRPRTRRRRTVIDFPPGAVLVCFTDGLVERRDEVIDMGLERLAAAVLPGEADKACASIMTALEVDRPTDDVALLTISRPAAAA